MSRLEWVISGFLGLIILIAIGGFLLWGMGYSNNALAQDASELPLSSTTPLHAREAYALALREAQTWASDSQLLMANATWPAHEAVQVGAPSWGFRFYSATKQSSALFIVSEGSARLLRSTASTAFLTPLNADAWLIDSDAVIESVMSNGGQAFVAGHSNPDLTLTLNLLEGFEWDARLTDTGTKETFTITVDPASGAIGANSTPAGLN